MNDKKICFKGPEIKPIDKEFELRSQIVYNLMPFKVREILLVSSLYDAFIIEEEGLISEMVIGEYRDLRLSSPPRVTRVSSGKQALEKIEKNRYHLVITMSKNIGMNPFVFGQEIKKKCENIPVILLATDSADLFKIQQRQDEEGIDGSFFWSGDSNLFLAIVKSIEDELNAPFDTKNANVRIIILLEDSIRYYSMFLPLIYSEIVNQTERTISEDVNEFQRLLRRRARPKILLASTYEEGMKIYQKYKNNILGIITDIGFEYKGTQNSKAGFKFTEEIRKTSPFLPILMQSSHKENKKKAEKLGAIFLHKHSTTLLQEFNHFLMNHLGFGDFIFLLPLSNKKLGNEKLYHAKTKKLKKASTLEEFEQLIGQVPLESLKFHASRNDFSNWLMARGEFKLATILRKQTIFDFKNLDELRAYLIDVFKETRRERQLGAISDFNQQTFEFDSSFTRIGGDSFGGKGRGIAFIRSLLYRYALEKKYSDVEIIVPNTIAIGTDEFDHFIKKNKLRKKLESNKLSDKRIAELFIKSKLRSDLKNRLSEVLNNFTSPLAVRSSSLLEDSQNHPFAGMYSTYMIPNNHKNHDTRLEQLCNSIKLVYASVFYEKAKQYIQATSISSEEEKMAIIIQELFGQNHDEYFYPTFSGVAQSYNYYPVDPQKPKDGIVSVASGLGTTVVGGENVLRFSPKHPHSIPDFSSTDQILENAQKTMYILDLSKSDVILSEEEKETLKKIKVSEIQHHGSLEFISSHYDRNDGMVRDGFSEFDTNLVTFSGVLKYDTFPLADLLKDLLKLGKKAMGCPVEIEFAVNLPYKDMKTPKTFVVLQIRPLIVSKEQGQVDIDNSISKNDILLKSDRALGHGVFSNIYDLIYVLPEKFDSAKTFEISSEVDKINRKLIEKNKQFILIGPGRWGTQDRWLGIPVNWSQISNSKVIVETDLMDFHIKPSQGTHFLQNIISHGIGYINVPYGSDKNFIDWKWLDKQKIEEEYRFIRHIKLKKPLIIKIDGKSRKAVILKSN